MQLAGAVGVLTGSELLKPPPSLAKSARRSSVCGRHGRAQTNPIRIGCLRGFLYGLYGHAPPNYCNRLKRYCRSC